MPEAKKTRNKWEPSEDAILLEHFAAEGFAVTKRLPGRSEQSIAGRVKILRKSPKTKGVLPENIRKSWTASEEALIIEHYPTQGSAMHTLLNDRSKEATISRASFLGVAYNPSTGAEHTEQNVSPDVQERIKELRVMRIESERKGPSIYSRYVEARLAKLGAYA